MAKVVEREIVVAAPADNVYQVWRNFETFSNFMDNIEEVRDIGYGRSHWKAKGPLGRTAEWDAEITRDEPGRVIAWQSLDGPDSPVRTQGSVEFESLGDGTRVHVAMSYEAPGGTLGDAATKLFANPERQVEEDLVRFKEMIEQPGYVRSTEEVVGHGTPDSEMRVNEPEDVDPVYATQGKYPHVSDKESPRGPGHPEEDETSRGHPVTTSTPGGTLGAVTEEELEEDQRAKSERESRM